MPTLSLFGRDTGLNEAIVRVGPIDCVMTLAWIKRHLTFLLAYPNDLHATRSSF